MHGTEEEVVLVGLVVRIIIIIFALGKLHTNNSMLKKTNKS